MRVTSIVALIVAIGLALGLGAGRAGDAGAQYPEPSGSVLLATASTAPDLGEEITITAAVLDEQGSAVAGAICTFQIAQQPGSDATVDGGPFVTNSAGNVSTTLYSGSTTGTVVVEAICDDLTAQVSMSVGAPAAPPGSLPQTGTGAEASGSGWSFWALIAAGLAIGLGGLALAWRRAKL